jgi:hypothetical protein
MCRSAPRAPVYVELRPETQGTQDRPQPDPDPPRRADDHQSARLQPLGNRRRHPHFDTIVRLADTLGVSLDELAGRKDVVSETTIRNHELNRLCRKVDQLPDEDQRALVVVLDSVVKRSRVSKLMAEI